MKTKKSIALICGAAGICMFTCAAAANYRISNGYDHLKTAIKNTREITNATININGELKVDDTVITTLNQLYELDSDANMLHSRSETNDLRSIINGEEPYIWETYRYNDKSYHRSLNEKNETIYIESDYFGTPENLWDVDEQDSEMVDKLVRFMEVAVDTIVGDLRNNFVCTESADEYSAYTVTLDSVQIPEIVNAGLSMVFSMAHNSMAPPVDDQGNTIEFDSDDENYYLMLLGKDPIAESVTLNYKIGADKTAQSGDIQITFAGNGHKMIFTGDISLTNIGSTTPQTLDQQNVKIVTHNYFDEKTSIEITE